MSSEEPTQERKRSRGLTFGGVAVGILLLPFLPLVLDMMEWYIFGSNHVWEFITAIGLDGILHPLYRVAIYRWFL
jgi:hypothetical protein